MEEKYELLKELGSGNFGVARLVKDKKTKELFAVKYIERGKKVISDQIRPFCFTCIGTFLKLFWLDEFDSELGFVYLLILWNGLLYSRLCLIFQSLWFSCLKFIVIWFFNLLLMDVYAILVNGLIWYWTIGKFMEWVYIFGNSFLVLKA